MTISNDGLASMAVPSLEPQQSITSNGAATVTSAPKKLHGRAFYESIGSPKFVLAPMVDQSEFAWRMLSRSFMPASSPKDLLAYTPMLHARMFTETPKFRDAHFQPLRTSLTSHPTSPSPTDPYLDGNPSIDRPLFAQFCANNPTELLNAAKYVAPFVDAVDLNLGCPQGIARKGKYGAFLQEDQELIYSLINKLHTELSVPVTAKIRILETKEKTLEYAQNVLKAGASILTVHGRTREMKGHKTGLADWSMIRFLRESLPKETVLFANGNILRKEDITRCLEVTGADGVMSAEGNLYDPAIFADPPAVGEEGREYWRGRDGKGGWRMDAVFRRYLDILYTHVLETPVPVRKPLYLPSDPEILEEKEEVEEKEEEEGPPKKKRKRGSNERTSNPNLLAMQPHLFHLLRPLVSKHHNVRDALARSRAGDIAAFENVLQLVEIAVRSGLKEYEDTNGKSWEEECERDERLKVVKESEDREKVKFETNGKVNGKDGEKGDTEMDESSIETVRECKRPWWVVQPYVRPLPKEALAKGSLTLSKKEKAALEAAATAAKRGSNRETDVLGTSGYVEVEVVGEGTAKEEIEVPKEGLVCG
ncbi:FMN-linked oxidoreductase [Stipitochalara longipes BDJ]|nr:FMN-linked oxidoreductase [Stipitochalara longipes BDJ]